MIILKLCIMVLSVFFSLGYGVALFEMLKLFNINQPPEQYFIIGFVIFLPLWILYLKDRHFYSTFEHELTHLLVGLIFLKKPAHFTVTHDTGGETGLYGGNFIITLAPYFLPTLSLIILPFYLIISHEYQLYFISFFGFVVCYHICSTIQEFSYRQPDIIKSGKLFSTVFLVFANIIVYGYIFIFIGGGFKAGNQYLLDGMLESFRWVNQIINHYIID